MHHYNSVLSLQIVTCNDSDSEHNYLWSNNTELQWCMGVTNNYTCYRQFYRLACPCTFYTCSAIHPTCPCTLYTCSTQYLLNIFGKFLLLSSIWSSICFISFLLSYTCYRQLYRLVWYDGFHETSNLSKKRAGTRNLKDF